MDERELKEYGALQREICELREEKEQLEAQALGAVRCEGMPGSGMPGDPVGNLAAMLSALDLLISEKERQLAESRVAIEKALSVLNCQDRCLLRRRYIYGDGVEVIARTLGYSQQHVWRLHKRALRRLLQAKRCE